MDNKELDKSRAEFEAWADEKGLLPHARAARWDGWQAALARAGTAAPAAPTDVGIPMSQRVVIEIVASELEDEVIPYEGDFADTVRSCAQVLRDVLAAPAAAVQPSYDLRAALQEFVDYHTKPAGMTLDIATDKAKCREFMESVDTRHSTMVRRAQALLASQSAATPEQSDTTKGQA